MARQIEIDGASKSWSKELDSGMGTRMIADVIAAASRELSQGIVTMKCHLASFVSYLENMQVKKEEKSMSRRILGWLKLLFKALAGIFALGSVISPFLRSVVPGVDIVAPAASAFCVAAAELCKAAESTSHGVLARTNE